MMQALRKRIWKILRLFAVVIATFGMWEFIYKIWGRSSCEKVFSVGSLILLILSIVIVALLYLLASWATKKLIKKPNELNETNEPNERGDARGNDHI